MRVRLCVLLGSIAAATLGLAGFTHAEPGDEPFKLADSQLEPVKWTDVEGWAADDQLAAFAAYQTSCQPFLKIKRPRDDRPIYSALWEVCRRAAALRPASAEDARAFFEENFRPVRIARLGEAQGFLTGYYEPIVQGSRFPNPEFHVPLYRRPRDLVAAGYKRRHRRLSQQGRADRSPQREQRDRALSRSRRHRGGRARRPEARNLLAQGSVRGAGDSDPGFGARDPRGRHAAADQLRLAQRLSLHGGRARADRAQPGPARGNVDAAHPGLDGGQSRRSAEAARHQPLLRLLPHHRALQRRRAGRRAGRSADARPLDRGRQDPRLRHAILHRSDACRSRAPSPPRRSAA